MKTEKLNTKSNYTHTKSAYNPALDYLEGKIIFKKKYEQAIETLSKTVFPQEVIDLITRKTNK